MNSKLPSAFAKKNEGTKKNPYDFEIPLEEDIFGKKKEVANKFDGVFEDNENFEEPIEEEVIVEEEDEPIKKVM